MNFFEQIAKKSRVAWKPALPADLERLRALKIPEEAIAFYGQSAPEHMVEIGKVRLCPIHEIYLENGDDFVPGCYAYPCGYVIFATSDCGDAYCFDTRAPGFPATAPIVLIAHDLEPDDDRMARQELARVAKPVASSFQNFLQAFVSESLDSETLYPPFGWRTSGGQTPAQ